MIIFCLTEKAQRIITDTYVCASVAVVLCFLHLKSGYNRIQKNCIAGSGTAISLSALQLGPQFGGIIINAADFAGSCDGIVLALKNNRTRSRVLQHAYQQITITSVAVWDESCIKLFWTG